METSQNESTPRVPPPLPKLAGKPGRDEAFALEYGPPPAGERVKIVDDLLKRPGRIAYALVDGRNTGAAAGLAAAMVGCVAIYGAIMGSFSGMQQLWVVPLKLAGGLLLSAAICAPSLYIFAALAGARQSFAQTCALLLQSLALCAFLLLGFAPVAWLFTQATRTAAFMGVLHLVFWSVALGFGLRLLGNSLRTLNGTPMKALRVWAVIFLAVVFQMATTLRPLVGPFEGYELKGKKFFVEHWFGSMKGK